MTVECGEVEPIDGFLLHAFYVKRPEQGVEPVLLPAFIIDLECMGILGRAECGGAVSGRESVFVDGGIAYQADFPFDVGRPAYIGLVQLRNLLLSIISQFTSLKKSELRNQLNI